MPTRFGRGYDSHLFGAERPLKLAGVEIPRPTGLARHFDGNAIACALTGRAARRGGASVTSVVCFPTPTRQYLPKQQSMEHLTQHDCNRIAAKLNNRPPKRLGYRTPKECYGP